MLSLFNLYKYIILFDFFKYSSVLAPLKNKIKSVLSKLKVYKKNSCSIYLFILFIYLFIYLFFFFLVVYFCFVIVWSDTEV